MALSEDQIRFFASILRETQDQELDCDDVLVYLAEWSERLLKGDSLENASAVVRQHLAICPECNEEFKLLTEVLQESLESMDDAGG